MTKITNFVWDPVDDCVISELDGTGTVQAVYTNEAQQYGGVLSQRRGTTTSTLHADALGTTRALTSSTQTTTDTYLYDAWGNSVASMGTTVNPFRWVGKHGYYTDNSTAQVYVRARMYQPTLARWASVDPVTIELADLNLFRYVRNNSFRSVDPSGMVEPCTVVIVGGIIVIWLCSGCSEPPPPTCRDGSPIPTAPDPPPNELPPWAQETVQCDGDPKGQYFAQVGCKNGKPVQRLCKQGLGELPPKTRCITDCLVQKENFALKLLKCLVRIPCAPSADGTSPGGSGECSTSLDCDSYKGFLKCIQACQQGTPDLGRDKVFIDILIESTKKQVAYCERNVPPSHKTCH